MAAGTTLEDCISDDADAVDCHVLPGVKREAVLADVRRLEDCATEGRLHQRCGVHLVENPVG